MNTEVRSERMVVISDLHIGNPFCSGSEDLWLFINQAREEGYDLCINGDGFDIMQTSLSEIITEIPMFIEATQRFNRQNNQIYYTVGNHDLPLEAMIASNKGLAFCPFMNLHSGGKRIRIEHGYLYDPNFVKNPERYERLVHLAGHLLKVAPNLYKFWMKYEKFKNRNETDHEGIPGEPREFFSAVKEICERGFDSVIFGHTHHPGSIERRDLSYYNTGSFMLKPYYALINAGEIKLCQWEKTRSLGEENLCKS